eukprot:gene32359-39950_t
MYTSKIPLNTYLKNAECVTQDLGLNFVAVSTASSSSSSSAQVSTSDVAFDIDISFKVNGSSNILMRSLQGIVSNDRLLKTPGQFTLTMRGVESDLWVLALGPVTNPHKTIASVDMLSTGGKHNGNHNGHHLRAKNHSVTASRRVSQHDDHNDDGGGDDGQNFDDANNFVVVLPAGNSSDSVLIMDQGGDDGGDDSTGNDAGRRLQDGDDDAGQNNDGTDDSRRLTQRARQQIGTKQKNFHGAAKKSTVGHDSHAKSGPTHAHTHRQLVADPEAPVTTLGEYPWAILSDSTGSQLFVLARDVAQFRAKYQSVVLQRVRELGFTAE